MLVTLSFFQDGCKNRLLIQSIAQKGQRDIGIRDDLTILLDGLYNLDRKCYESFGALNFTSGKLGEGSNCFKKENIGKMLKSC